MIIGFTGLMGVGKTTAAKHLIEQGFVSVNFKDALVWEIKKNFPRLMEEMISALETIHYDGLNPWTVDRLFNEKPPVFRALMQEYGTEVRRGDNKWHWTGAWAKKASELEKVVVDDIRFLNEAECVRNAGGHIIRIDRLDINDTGSHQSESEMSKIVPETTITVAEGEIQELFDMIDALMLHYK